MFVGKDVATALGYRNPSNALQVHVDPEDKTTYPIQVSGSNYKTNALFVNTKDAQGRQLSNEEIIDRADVIVGRTLRMLNEGAEDTLTATQVAKTFNMTVFDFNCVVRDMGIQYYRHGRWNISDDLVGRDLVRLRTHVSYSLKGVKKVRTYMTWTISGLKYLNSKLGYPNF